MQSVPGFESHLLMITYGSGLPATGSLIVTRPPVTHTMYSPWPSDTEGMSERNPIGEIPRDARPLSLTACPG